MSQKIITRPKKPMAIIITVIVVLSLLVIILIAGCGLYQWRKTTSSLPILPPSEIVNNYLKATLGAIPGTTIDYPNYEPAKQLLTQQLREKFTDPSFVPLSYCIQNGPSEVKIVSEKTLQNSATIRVSGFYTDWQEMWDFILTKDDNQWKIAQIECLR